MLNITKKSIRKEVMRQLRALPEDVRHAESLSVYHKVLSRINFEDVKVVGLFISMSAEVNTRALIATALSLGKRVFVPRVDGKAMTMLEINTADNFDGFPQTKWGIPEPPQHDRATLENLAQEPGMMIIVPGVAFNRDGVRLGHGGGYYDRYLASMNRRRTEAGLKNVQTIGIGLTCQMLTEKIPFSDHDVCIDDIICG